MTTTAPDLPHLLAALDDAAGALDALTMAALADCALEAGDDRLAEAWRLLAASGRRPKLLEGGWFWRWGCCRCGWPGVLRGDVCGRSDEHGCHRNPHIVGSALAGELPGRMYSEASGTSVNDGVYGGCAGKFFATRREALAALAGAVKGLLEGGA